MRIDRTSWLTALAAIGAALVTFPFLPGDWPNPLPEGEGLTAADLMQLEQAVTRVDLACDRGDLEGFGEAVTEAHRTRLARQLQAVAQPFDAEVLRRFASQRRYSLRELLRRPVLASEVRGQRAVLAMSRPAGDGAQILEFEWDGRKLRLDGSRHAAAVGSRERARAVVVDAVATRR
ncbi:MAG: hypothetical protein KDC98_21655 [Planctomycetes bacterium]|nr:hypothetical protein [Planctomycetota bacterium]